MSRRLPDKYIADAFYELYEKDRHHILGLIHSMAFIKARQNAEKNKLCKGCGLKPKAR